MTSEEVLQMYKSDLAHMRELYMKDHTQLMVLKMIISRTQDSIYETVVSKLEKLMESAVTEYSREAYKDTLAGLVFERKRFLKDVEVLMDEQVERTGEEI